MPEVVYNPEFGIVSVMGLNIPRSLFGNPSNEHLPAPLKEIVKEIDKIAPGIIFDSIKTPPGEEPDTFDIQFDLNNGLPKKTHDNVMHRLTDLFGLYFADVTVSTIIDGVKGPEDVPGLVLV